MLVQVCMYRPGDERAWRCVHSVRGKSHVGWRPPRVRARAPQRFRRAAVTFPLPDSGLRGCVCASVARSALSSLWLWGDADCGRVAVFETDTDSTELDVRAHEYSTRVACGVSEVRVSVRPCVRPRQFVRDAQSVCYNIFFARLEHEVSSLSPRTPLRAGREGRPGRARGTRHGDGLAIAYPVSAMGSA